MFYLNSNERIQLV